MWRDRQAAITVAAMPAAAAAPLAAEVEAAAAAAQARQHGNVVSTLAFRVCSTPAALRAEHAASLCLFQVRALAPYVFAIRCSFCKPPCQRGQLASSTQQWLPHPAEAAPDAG